MSIASKRLSAYVDDFVAQALKEGRLPEPLEVRRALNKFARDRVADGPSLKMRKQSRRGQMDVDGHNAMVGEIVSDLNFLFAEQVDQANRLLHAVNESEIKYEAFLYQIDVLGDLLETLLLVEPKASGFFFSVGDEFRSLALVDQEQTTARVDLAAGVVTLPVAGGARKIPMPHLAKKTNAAVVSDDPDSVVQSGLLPGAKYGYAFDDTVRAWQHRIQSTRANGWSGSITMPIAMYVPRVDAGAALTLAPETIEMYISRVDLDGLAGTEMQAKVLYSVDGKNYMGIPGHDWLILEGRRQSLYFPKLKVEFLRILLRKDTPDESADSHTYIVGFRNISVYDAGFAVEGDVVSKTLDPDMSTRIGRVVLYADEQVPEGTAIEYYVAEATASPTWRPIQPAERAVEGAPPILDFSKSVPSPRRDNRVLVTSTPAVNSARNGISFYNLTTLAAGHVPDTAKVYRGVDGWGLKVNDVEERVQVRDNFVVFTRDDSSQQLYIEIEEEVTPTVGSTGTTATSVRVRRPIFSSDPSINVIPARDSSSQIPDYAIAKVLLLKAAPPSSSGVVTITEASDTSRVVAYAPTNMALDYVKIGDYIYIVQGTVAEFFKIVVVTNGSSPYIEIYDPNNLLVNGGSLWSLNSYDITQKIESTLGDTFQIAADVTIYAADKILITYRSPLTSREGPLSSSIVVKDMQGGMQYELGRDYVYDAETKSITRRPEGRITVTGDSRIVVRVDFQFKRLTHRLDTYTTWLRYEGDGTKIDMAAAIAVSPDIGESVFLQTSKTTAVDLSLTTSVDGLARGWRLLTVRSRPLLTTAGMVDTQSAIYKVINAVDSQASLLFGPAHFAEHRATLNPLKPLSLFCLQTSVGKDDRDAFAVDGNTVVINWDPTANRDMLYLAPGTTVVQTRERFEIEYRKRGSDTAVESLLFKAVLSRNEGFPADRTPVLHGYRLRLAY